MISSSDFAEHSDLLLFRVEAKAKQNDNRWQVNFASLYFAHPKRYD
jgi:hypothetical protein